MSQPIDDFVADQPTVAQAVWRYRWAVLGIILLFGIGGLAFGVLQDPRYEASSLLLVEQPAQSVLEDVREVPSEAYLAAQEAVASSQAVAEEAAEILAGGDPPLTISPDELIAGVFPQSDPATGFFSISYTAPDPETARLAADALSAAFAQVGLAAARDAATAQIEGLDAALELVRQDLDAVQQAIIAARSPEAAELDALLDQALSELVELRRRRPTASPEGLLEIREELADLTNELATTQLYRSLEAERPELAGLLREFQDLLGLESDLSKGRQEIEIERELATSGVAVLAPAGSGVPLGRGAPVTVAVFVILGSIVAAFVAYYLAYRKHTFAGSHEPERILGAPLLAEIPDFAEDGVGSDLPCETDPNSTSAEAFRFVASALLARRPRRDEGALPGGGQTPEPRVIVVISASLGEGKSVVAANTAVAAALGGGRVIAIDGDFSSGDLTALLARRTPTAGLGVTDAVLTGLELSATTSVVDVSGDGVLRVMARGEAAVSATAFFQSKALPGFLDRLRQQFDLIIIDAPPLLQVAYAGPLARLADAAVVVVSHNGEIVDAEELADRLAFVGTPILGYVYNRAPLRRALAGPEGSAGSPSVQGRFHRSPGVEHLTPGS